MEMEHIQIRNLPGRLVVPQLRFPNLIVRKSNRNRSVRSCKGSNVLGCWSSEPVRGIHHPVNHKTTGGESNGWPQIKSDVFGHGKSLCLIKIAADPDPEWILVAAALLGRLDFPIYL